MVRNRTNVVMIIREDIKHLPAEGEDASQRPIKRAKTRYPVNRYEGSLLFNDNALVFDGWDIKEKKQFVIEIPIAGIINVCVGFRRNLKENVDPVFGIAGTVPFVISYSIKGENQTAYFNTCSDSYPPHQYINNIRWYEELSEIVARHKVFKAG